MYTFQNLIFQQKFYMDIIIIFVQIQQNLFFIKLFTV